MADTMSPLPPPPPPPAPAPAPPALASSASKGGRIHHHRRRRHREGLGFTDSDVAAAHQLIQLSDDSDEDKRRPAKGGGGGGGAVDREVASARIEEIFGRESGDRRRDRLGLPRKKRYRSIAEIYAETTPMEFRRMGGHHMIR